MEFDEFYYNGDGDLGYKNYEKFPHFKQRALWIKENLSGKILVLGCAYGFLVEELRDIGVEAYGVESSKYAYDKIREDIKQYVQNIDIGELEIVEDKYDWVVSWNVLECLNDEFTAEWVSEVLNYIAVNQLHTITMKGAGYDEDGYFIRPMKFWRELLPFAHLICYGTVLNTPQGEKPFTNIPQCWGGSI